MNLQDCEAILAAAIKKNLFKGDLNAARRYLNAGDVEGFERVCRGNYEWLKYKDIAYVLTDGSAENWHDNGLICGHFNYVNGKLHGECMWWHNNGQLGNQLSYVDGDPHGQHMRWHADGKLFEQSTYINGVKQL
jgi:antitoxin component YwqK of YwqJK toxin-antitoxin module